MALVEACEQRLDGEATLRPGDGQLEALVAIAEIGQAGDPSRVRRHGLGREPCLRLPLQLGVDGADGGSAYPAASGDVRA